MFYHLFYHIKDYSYICLNILFMPTTKILLFEHKAKKNGEVPLYLRVIKDRKPRYVSLKLNVLPKYWDTDKEKVKSGHPNAVRMNNYLTERVRDALDNLLELETTEPNAPVTALKHVIMGVPVTDFFTYGFNFIKQFENKGKIGTYRRFESALNKLRRYTGDKEFSFTQITDKFLREYEYYLRTDLSNKQNTIVGNFKVIRRIFNQAYKERIFDVKRNPFSNIKLVWAPSERVFLTEEELTALENLKLDPNSIRYHQRNMYLFACNAGGIRISDLIQLKWENFSGEHVLLTTHKTGAVISVKLPKKALDIINQYKTNESKPDEFIFPFLEKSDDLNDPKYLQNRITSIISYTNAGLVDLAIDAGIEKHIHFHTSRHTWATRALRKGMRIEYVSKLMGHSSIRTTQVYTKIVNADLDKAMEVFDDVPAVPEEKKKKTVIGKKSKK